MPTASRFFVPVWCLILVALWKNPVAAQDWPEFRGPDAQGHSNAKNLPVEWDEEKNIAWKTDLAGEGWSSPSLSRGKLYLTSAVKAEDGSYSLRVLGLDARSGKIDWDVEVFQQTADAPKIHSKNSHASPTPIVSSGRLYVHFGHEGSACLGLDGKIIWKNNEFKYPPVHGNGGSVCLVDGRLIFACDGAENPVVMALDANTGKELWKYKRPTEFRKTFAFSTPLAITVGNQKQVIIPGAGSVSAIRPEDGTEIWHVTYDGYSVIPRPVFAGGLVFVSTSYDSPSVLAIRPDGKGDVTETHVEWSLKKGAPHTPSMLAVGDELYMVSDAGVASCVDVATGKVHWQKRIGGNYSASLVFADGKIYLQNEEGEGQVIAPGKKFEQLGSTKVGQRTLSSYAVGDGAIFVRGDKSLFRVEEGKKLAAAGN